jgi:dimethylaniline monooxygenase (N-oxide forming)
MDPNSSAPTRIIISDTYLEKIKNKQISVKKGRIQELKDNSILFNDGTKEEADVIIFSSGYKLDLPFLIRLSQLN